jgi:hypothetical protein
MLALAVAGAELHGLRLAIGKGFLAIGAAFGGLLAALVTAFLPMAPAARVGQLASFSAFWPCQRAPIHRSPRAFAEPGDGARLIGCDGTTRLIHGKADHAGIARPVRAA